MESSEISAFSRLFLSVDARHRQELNEMTGVARDLYDALQPSHAHIGESALERLLPSDDKQTGDLWDVKQFLYFKPIQDDQVAGWTLPLVSLRFNFGAEPLQLRIFLALAQMVQGQVRIHGFRFDAPEGAGGRHDFYHVQLIRSFVRDGVALNPPTSDLAVVPEKQPSFPIKADSPVTLAIAFFVSLYGMPFLTEFSKLGEVPERYFRHFR